MLLLKSLPVMVWYDSEILANWLSIRSKTLDSFSLVYLKIFGILYAQAIQVLLWFFKEVFPIFIQDIFLFIYEIWILLCWVRKESTLESHWWTTFLPSFISQNKGFLKVSSNAFSFKGPFMIQSPILAQTPIEY